jgi:hypothetical protein
MPDEAQRDFVPAHKSAAAGSVARAGFAYRAAVRAPAASSSSSRLPPGSAWRLSARRLAAASTDFVITAGSSGGGQSKNAIAVACDGGDASQSDGCSAHIIERPPTSSPASEPAPAR